VQNNHRISRSHLLQEITLCIEATSIVPVMKIEVQNYLKQKLTYCFDEIAVYVVK
jgi:thermostable 8-oxoguanine DNA glycosylase